MIQLYQVACQFGLELFLTLSRERLWALSNTMSIENQCDAIWLSNITVDFMRFLYDSEWFAHLWLRSTSISPFSKPLKQLIYEFN